MQPVVTEIQNIILIETTSSKSVRISCGKPNLVKLELVNGFGIRFSQLPHVQSYIPLQQTDIHILIYMIYLYIHMWKPVETCLLKIPTYTYINVQNTH